MVSRVITYPHDAPVLSAEASARLVRLYRLHSDRVVRLAYHRTGDHHVAQDVAGETWLQAANWIDTLQADDEAAFGWLATIAKRAVADYYRRPRNTETPMDWADPVAGRRLPSAPPADEVLPVGDDPFPSLPLIWRDGLAQLPPVQREILVWRSEGLSWRAVCEQVDRPRTSVRDAARRGARTLAEAVTR